MCLSNYRYNGRNGLGPIAVGHASCSPQGEWRGHAISVAWVTCGNWLMKGPPYSVTRRKRAILRCGIGGENGGDVHLAPPQKHPPRFQSDNFRPTRVGNRRALAKHLEDARTKRPKCLFYRTYDEEYDCAQVRDGAGAFPGVSHSDNCASARPRGASPYEVNAETRPETQLSMAGETQKTANGGNFPDGYRVWEYT